MSSSAPRLGSRRDPYLPLVHAPSLSEGPQLFLRPPYGLGFVLVNNKMAAGGAVVVRYLREQT